MATPLPPNRASFTVAELVLALDAVVVGGRAPEDLTTVGVSTDSRKVAPGELFVPLRGETFDGHDHLAGAIAKGAKVVLVDRDVASVSPSDAVLLRVPDTLRALGLLARAHRRRWGSLEGRREVVGITGSAGKTTTRHATAHMLRALGSRVHASHGNLNNFIGAPISVLGFEPAHDVGVIELGMNQPGEIATLAGVAEPTVGIVTLVSHAHTAGVGSIWGVAKEKSDLVAALPSFGACIVNADVPLAAAAAIRTPARRRLSYGATEGATVRLIRRRMMSLERSVLEIELRGSGAGGPVRRFEAEVALLGDAGASACLAAVCAALAVHGDVRADELARALREIPPNEAGRLDVTRRADGAIVVNDAYNANPASMKSSIRAAREIATLEKKPLVLVLGTMFELGDEAEALHFDVGLAAAAAAPDEVVVVGEGARSLERGYASKGGRTPNFAKDAHDAEALLSTLELAESVVLVKASNSMGLGPVAARLAEGATR